MGMECGQSSVRLCPVIDFLVDIHPPLGNSWFEPSSIMKVVFYRVSRTHIDRLNDLVGQHEGKVVDLLESSEYNVRYMHVFMLKTI